MRQVDIQTNLLACGWQQNPSVVPGTGAVPPLLLNGRSQSVAVRHINTPLPSFANLPPPHLSAIHHDHRFAVRLSLAILRRLSPILDPPSKVLFAGFTHNFPGTRLCVVSMASNVNHAIWISPG
jgi:hypothetical protein